MVWQTLDHDFYLPLYEAKFVWHFDHRFSSYHNYGKVKGRGGRGLPPVQEDEYSDVNFRIQPRYWVSEKELIMRIRQEDWPHKWFFGFRDVTSAKLERTFVSSFVPRSAIGNKFPIIVSSANPELIVALCACLNSIPFDYFVRQKIGGTTMNYFIVEQLPVLPPSQFSEFDLEYIRSRVLQLVYTAQDMKEFAKDLGFDGVPFKWDSGKRAILQSELDAYFARLYCLNRDELRYILDPSDVCGENYPSETFRVLKERETKEYGEYRTQRLVLEAWDRLEAGQLISAA
jgi:hypothetical protein